MFSKEMEDLIQATLEDGYLEENEKAALVKRAQRENVDLRELEIHINSLLQRRQRELNEKKNRQEEEFEKEKAKAIGPVCPKCGKQVPPLTLVCDCGYEFTKKKDVSSVQLLFETIKDIQLTSAEIDSCSDVVKEEVNKEYRVVHDAYGNAVKKVNDEKIKELKEKKKHEIISSFPVPNTKEDIMEFLALSAPNAKQKGGLLGTRKGRILLVTPFVIVLSIIVWIMSDKEAGGLNAFVTLGFGCTALAVFATEFDKSTLRYNEMAQVWKAKFDQVLLKGRSLRADPEFTQKLDYYENLLYSNEKTTGGMMDNLNVDYKKVGKISLFILGALIVIFLLVKLFSGTSKDNNENSDIDNVESVINGADNDNIGETEDVSGGASDASDEMLKAQEQAAEQMREAQEEAAEQMRKAQEEMRKAMGQ